jgi:16S rRNA (cytidine1402-2'-O)-methyltransferase
VAHAQESVQPLGQLWLFPNTLDLGCPPPSGQWPALTEGIAPGVLQRAAGVAHWVVENAKAARLWLKRVHETTPLAQPLQSLSVVELPRPRKGAAGGIGAAEWRRLLEPASRGHDIGLLSDAGLPAIADPGAQLVAAAHAMGLRVRPLPGPSSLLMALSASGLNGQSFAFVGYLPTDAGQRAQKLCELEAHSRRFQQTQFLIETPYRNRVMLEALLAGLHSQTWLSVGCGLTLPQESIRSDTVAGWRASKPTLPDDVPAVFLFLAS